MEKKLRYMSKAKNLILVLDMPDGKKDRIKFSDGQADLTKAQDEVAINRSGIGWEFWPVGYRTVEAVTKAEATVNAQIAALEQKKKDLELVKLGLASGKVDPEKVTGKRVIPGADPDNPEKVNPEKPDSGGSSSFDDKDAPESIDYETMSTKELKALAEERHMTVVSNMSKTQLVAAHVEFDKANQPPVQP